jgi:putative flippase GtrA
MKHTLTQFLDIFYPPFRRLMPIQTFRYAACGGGNALFGLCTYYLGYHYIFDKQVFDIGFFAFKPHMAALFGSSAITFIIGFLLNKYVVFTESYLRGRIQLFRYFLSFSSNLVINYFLLKLMVEILKWNAMLSQVITICIVIGISYLTQRHYTFKSKKKH